jgi:hypothetical protein
MVVTVGRAVSIPLSLISLFVPECLPACLPEEPRCRALHINFICKAIKTYTTRCKILQLHDVTNKQQFYFAHRAAATAAAGSSWQLQLPPLHTHNCASYNCTLLARPTEKPVLCTLRHHV